MSTEQQDVADAKRKIASLKKQYSKSIEKYIGLANEKKTLRDSAILECQQKANSYFNYVEEFVGNSSLLGAHEDALWAQGFAEDCAEILGSMPAHFRLLKQAFENSPSLKNISFLPGTTAYANMQRMVTLYLGEEQRDSLKRIFLEESLPTYGFQNKAKNPMQLEKLLAYIFGVTFIVVLLAIAFVKPDPSKFQYTIFRTVLALAAAGIGAVIPGTLRVKVNSWVRAGGAIALFVLVYFWIPA